MKKCSKCKIEKEDDIGFCKSVHRPDGLMPICRECEAIRKREYYIKNKAKVNAKSAEYYETNKEYIKTKVKEWSRSHPDQVRENARLGAKRRRQSVVVRLRQRVSGAIWYALHSQYTRKDNKTWKMLPYTPEELKKHLESLWEDWMSWDNYGMYDENRKTWNIDHIKPQSAFIYDSLSHPNFLECWKLSNLQPLDALQNILKGDKLL